jgi:hypothetical protein
MTRIERIAAVSSTVLALLIVGGVEVGYQLWLAAQNARQASPG